MSQPSRKELANAIRVLTMDAVETVRSGHPGMPMGMADIAEVLWNDFLQHNPSNPNWFNRDRVILSNGHGCLLQYAALHLSGYDISLNDLKAFRQLHSKTPGHPEYGVTPGVETTTGPLGQGLGNAVGMALAEALLATEYNKTNHVIVDHYTYCFVGDGCLMEGISHEVASLAGTLGLGKLIVFYDDNQISIDGKVSGWFLDNTPKRFEAYGWHVIAELDGHNADAIFQAIQSAQQETNKPSLICCKTIIGYGAPNLAGSEQVHGSPLGIEEVKATKRNLNWPEEAFHVPAPIYEAWDAKKQGQLMETNWLNKIENYKNTYPELAKKFTQRILHDPIFQQESHKLLDKKITDFIHIIQHKKEKIATRKSSQQVLEVLIPFLPELIGGSADLSESNATFTQHSKPILPRSLSGNYIHYGVREFGMATIMNGLALHNGFIPYGGTFLTFLDYARNAVRLSALMKLQVIYIYSHDSVGLGEDGPTHQPIEHLSMLRATPNLFLWRPCDTVETAIAWQMALKRHNGPTSIALTRQAVSQQRRNEKQINDIKRGAYILHEVEDPALNIIATGSEVDLAMSAAQQLIQEGINIQVVSMPCMELFLDQSHHYQESILPKKIPCIAIEAGASQSWYRWVGVNGKIIGIDRFGESAPGDTVFKAMDLTVDRVIQVIRDVILSMQQQKNHLNISEG